jgi:DNA-binding CsgD family transcriptional regulator
VLTHFAERPEELPDHAAELKLRCLRRDGSVRELHALAELGRDDAGRPERVFGAAQDVTEPRQSERGLLALDGVSHAIGEWKSLELGGVDLLRRIADPLGYPLASLWLWDSGEDALRCCAFWSVPYLDADGFEALERGAAVHEGEGAPGLAWQTREPAVGPPVAGDPVVRRRNAGGTSTIASTVAFPAVAPAGPLAVVLLYSLERRVPSAELMPTLSAIGRELGRFFNGRRGELGWGPLTKRELEVLALASAGVSGPKIAERLFTSPSTVKTHFANIYAKLGVGDRAAAVAVALRTGLIH